MKHADTKYLYLKHKHIPFQSYQYREFSLENSINYIQFISFDGGAILYRWMCVISFIYISHIDNFFHFTNFKIDFRINLIVFQSSFLMNRATDSYIEKVSFTFRLQVTFNSLRSILRAGCSITNTHTAGNSMFLKEFFYIFRIIWNVIVEDEGLSLLVDRNRMVVEM